MDGRETNRRSYQLEVVEENPTTTEASEGEGIKGEGGEESDNLCISCLRGFWHVISWMCSVLTYLAELFVVGWVAWFYASRSYYPLLAVTLGYVAPPTIVLMIVSLVWYADLDRFYQKQREGGNSNNPFVKQYKKKLTAVLVIVHVMCLGVVYRYGELIYVILARKTTNLKFLVKDAALLRFLHSFLITAPQVVIHLYTFSVSANSDKSFHTSSDIPLFALATCMVSLAYSVLAFTTSDRLSGKDRRVVLPAHLLQVLWYACLLAARIIAFGLFAHAYGPYVFVIVAAHWIVVFFGILRWQTTFCSDIAESEIKSRWYLEVPFNFLAACVYIFVFFNLKEGRTRFPSVAYHVLVFVENAVMVALFFANQRGLSYSTASIPVVVGLFLLGVAFMVLFYLLFHPRKTFEWYWIGLPRNGCSGSKEQAQESTDSVEPNPKPGRVSVNISDPTLISMNGAIPGLSVKFGDKGFRPPSGSGLRSGQIQYGNELPRVGLSPPSDTSQPNVSNVSLVSPPFLSPPQATDAEDKSIDSPISFLAETSPSATTYQKGSDSSHYDTLASARSFSPSKDVRSHQSPESGLEVSDHQHLEGVPLEVHRPFVRKPPTPYPIRTLEVEIEEEEREKVKYPYFSHIPAKKPDYLTQRTQLEQHYFPDKGKHPVWSPQVTQSPQAVAVKQTPQNDPEYFHFPSPTHQSSRGQRKSLPPSNQQAQSSPSQRNRGYSSGHTPSSPERRRAHYNQPQPQAGSERGEGGGGGGAMVGERGPRRNLPLYGQVYSPERTRRQDARYSSVGPSQVHASSHAPYGANLNAGYRDKFSDPPHAVHGTEEQVSRSHWSQNVPTHDQRQHQHTGWSADPGEQREEGRTAAEDRKRPRMFSEGSNRSPRQAKRSQPRKSYGFPTSQGVEGRGRDALPPDWATRHPPDIVFTYRSPQVTRAHLPSSHHSLQRPKSYHGHTTGTLPLPHPHGYAPHPSQQQDYMYHPVQDANPHAGGYSYHGNRGSYHSNKYPPQNWTKENPFLHTPTANAPISQV